MSTFTHQRGLRARALSVMRLNLGLLLASSLLACAACAQPADSGSPDINLHLMIEEVGEGTSIDHIEDVALLTTSDFSSVSIHHRADAPNPEFGYSLLFRLTPEGSERLASVVGQNQGRSLVLQSHGQSFNALRLQGQFEGEWLLWPAPLQKMIAERWLRHVTGEELLPDPFAEDA